MSKAGYCHPEIPPDDFFHILQGLREGSKLSPLLFNLDVDDMNKVLTAPQPGTHTNLGVFVPGIKGRRGNSGSLRRTPATFALPTSNILLSAWTYSINHTKSNVMRLDSTPFVPDQSFSFPDYDPALPNRAMPIVDSFKYLGLD